MQSITNACLDLQTFILSAEAIATHGKLWHVLFAAIAVALWTARNALVFRTEAWTASRVFKEIHQLIHVWKHRARRDQDLATLCNFAALFL